MTGAALIQTFRQFDVDTFAWRQPPYEYEHEKLPFDILAGSSELRQQIETGVSDRAIADSWKSGLNTFAKQRKSFLLY
jgi:uncharacterized protein YbbC (DUF1343 family)